jgi:hypothetical protein
MNEFVRILISGLAFILFLQGTADAQYHTHGFPGIEPVEKLNYDSLLTVAVSLDNSEEGTKLLNDCIEKYGGRSKLEDLRSFKLVYEMQALMAGPHKVEVNKLFQRDRKYTIIRKRIDGTEQRILNRDKAWFVGSDTMYVFEPVRYKSELFSYLTLAMPLAASTERFDDIRYGTRHADSLHYIYLDKKDTLMIILGIDPAEKVIKTSEGYIRKKDGGIVFINQFSDFREVDGYIFPYRLVNISMGLEVGKSTLVDIEINPEFDDNDFLPSEKTY